MAKKKTPVATKKTKSNTSSKLKPEPVTPTVVAPGYINVVFTEEELNTVAGLLGVCANVFEGLALQSAQQNEEENYKILSARHQLCKSFAIRLTQFLKLGEPTSGNVH